MMSIILLTSSIEIGVKLNYIASTSHVKIKTQKTRNAEVFAVKSRFLVRRFAFFLRFFVFFAFFGIFRVFKNSIKRP